MNWFSSPWLGRSLWACMPFWLKDQQLPVIISLFLGWFLSSYSTQDLLFLLDLWLELSLLRFLSLLPLSFTFSGFIALLLDFTLIRPPVGIFPSLFCKTVWRPESPSSMAYCWNKSGVKSDSAFDFMSSCPMTNMKAWFEPRKLEVKKQKWDLLYWSAKKENKTWTHVPRLV